MFVSRRWERNEPQWPVGELQDSFAHVADYQPPGVTGASFCGSAEQWLHGCLTSDPLPAINPANGTRVCCASRVQLGEGGESEGGSPGVPIPGCAGPAPPLLYGVIALNGTPGLVRWQVRFVWSALGYWVCVDHYLSGAGVDYYGSRLYPPTTPGVWRYFFSAALTPWFLQSSACGPDFWVQFIDEAFPTPIDTINEFFARPKVNIGGIGAGGEAEGGRGWIWLAPVNRGEGGEAAGGEGTVSLVRAGLGGEAEGGEGLQLPVDRGQGGEAEGGEGRQLGVAQGQGGDAEGGDGSP